MPFSLYIRDPNEVLALSPSDLAGYLVQELKTYTTAFPPTNIAITLDNQYPGFNRIHELKESVMEAFAWLVSEGLVIHDYSSINPGWYRLSKRARQLNAPRDINAIIRVREILPKALLHPIIAQEAVPSFNNGKYDTAVFEAYKQTEIVLRKAVGNPKLDGVDLVYEAFRPVNAGNPNSRPGILTDISARESEQKGIMSAFEGAMLAFRNPTGHQNLDLHPEDAAGLIVFASYLMGIIEKRIASLQSSFVASPLRTVSLKSTII